MDNTTASLPADIFDNNMRMLQRHFPRVHEQLRRKDAGMPFPVRPFSTPGGQINIAATLPDGNTVHFYEEADITGDLRLKMADWQLEAGDFLFCVGIGLGYVPLMATRQFAGRPRIVVIEPDPEVMRLVLRCVDLRQLLTYEHLDIFLGPDLPVSDIIGRYGERIFFGKNRLISHGPSRLIYGASFKRLEHEIIENIRVARNIGYTAKHAGKTIFANTMDNLPDLFSGPDLGSLKDRFKGCPAICVAAGPSLDKDLEQLKAVGHRALILCTDSAVRSLVDAGIHPHMVVTTDMNPVNFEKLRTSIDCLRESVLVFSIEANPDNVRTFLGHRRIAVTSNNAILNRWLGPKWSLDWTLPAMTSVSHTALFTALGLGAGPIILLGMDFAYADGKSHASGSIVRYAIDPDEAIQADGVRGFPVNSLPQLSTDRKQIENCIGANPGRVIDASLDGALIKGAENRSLSEVVETVFSDNTDVSCILDSIDWTPTVPATAVIEELEAMATGIDHFLADCRVNIEKCRFDSTAAGQAIPEHKPAQRETEVKTALAAFENKNSKLLSLLKLIRYADVKAIAGRLSAARTVGGNGIDRESSLSVVLDIYADHYGSLEKAARFFKTSLIAVNNYLTQESERIQPVDSLAANPGPFLDLAEYYRSHNIIWKAEQAYLQYIDHRPDDFSAWIQLGRMFADKALLSLAQHYAQRMKKRFPDEKQVQAFDTEIAQSIKSLCGAAAASMAVGNPEEARRKLYEYRLLGGDDECSRKLQEKFDCGDQPRALDMPQPARIQLSQDRKQELVNRVNGSLENGAVENAIGILEGMTLQNDAETWQVRERIGDIRRSQGDHPSAQWHYRLASEHSAVHSRPTSKRDSALQPKSECNNQGKTMTEYSDDFQYDTATVVDSAEAMYRNAQEVIEKEAYPEAIEALEELLLRYPTYALAHNDLGVLCFNEGKTEQSFLHYQEAARLEPDHPVFQKNLADFQYIVNHDVQPALKIYVDLLAKDPEDKEVLLALGKICTEQEKFDDAAFFFRRILELEPMNGDAREGLDALSGRGSNPPSDELPLEDNNEPAAAITGQEQPSISPSPIIKTEIAAGDRRYVVQIPEQEMFRIKSIFDLNEYAIMDKRRGTGKFTAFDVGSNVGIFALSVHAIHPQSRIYCFEPSPLAQTLLEANVGGFPEMSICKYGLFNRDMHTTMHIHQYNTGQNSIRFDGQHHNDSVSIQLMDAGRQFDALGLSHLDILKVDTEGCEVEILESMGERLDMVDYVLVEYHSEKDRRVIDQLLSSFHLFGASALLPGIGTVKYIHPALV